MANAFDDLTATLVDLAGRRGTVPVCAATADDERNPWLDERPTERAVAADLCTGCPVLDACAAVGAGERFGVFGGVDRTVIPGRKPGGGRAA